MIIDLTNLIISKTDKLEINLDVEIDPKYYKETSIKKLKNIFLDAIITKCWDDEYIIEGTIKGIMVLPDDITLEDVDYTFNSNISEKFYANHKNEENNLEIIKNRLDITEFLWQNILVEIPLKVINPKNKDITLKGDGWRLVTEEELNTSNNSPLSELSNILNSRKE